MRITFRKTHQRGYAVDIARTRANDLTMNPAPGYDDLLPHDLLPHDLVHLLVEVHWGLRDGIYGDVAAGGNAGTFRLADDRPAHESSREHSRKARRAGQSRGGAGRSRAGTDMGRSERLAGVVHARWQARQHGTPLPDWYPLAATAAAATEAEIEAALREAEGLSARWRKLQVRHGMALDWPWRARTFRPDEIGADRPQRAPKRARSQGLVPAATSGQNGRSELARQT